MNSESRSELFMESLWSSLLAASGIFLLLYALYRVARWARTRAKGAYALGALIVPLGAAGNVADPDFRIVHEAQQLKKREEDDAGDPVDDE